MHRLLFALLTLSSLSAVAQTAPPVDAATPPATATSTPLLLTAPADTLREYRLSELSRVRYDNLQLRVTGGTPEQAAAFEAQLRAAFGAREGERNAVYKQFLKVLPSVGAGKYLFNTLTLGSDPAVSSRSVRTLGAAGSLTYQKDAPAVGTSADALVTALLGQVSDELARTHAELLSNFDPASFGILGSPLTVGQTFIRLKTLQPPYPFAALPGQQLLGRPLQVEQQLTFEGEKDGQLVFSRAARVVQPGQIVSGGLDMLLTLTSYVYDGTLRLSPDGLPANADRGEAYAVQAVGRVKQGELTTEFSFVVRSTSVLTLTPLTP